MIERKHLIQFAVVALALVFIFSSLSLLFRGQQTPTPSQTQPVDIYKESVVAMGTVSFEVSGYKPSVRIVNATNDTKDLVDRWKLDGKVMYSSEEGGTLTVVLSDADLLPELVANLSEKYYVDALLKPSSERVSLKGVDGSLVWARLPTITVEITPYRPEGYEMAFDVIARVYNESVLALKVSPSVHEYQQPIIFKVENVSDRYRFEFYFYWHDRMAAFERVNETVEALEKMGANVTQRDFIRQDIVILDRIPTSQQEEMIKERFPDVKMVWGNQVVVRKNATYTEDELAEGLKEILGNDTEVSFQPAFLNLSFTYDGNISEVYEYLSSVEPEPILMRGYVWATVKTLDKRLLLDQVEDELLLDKREYTFELPYDVKEGSLHPVEVRITVEGNRVVDMQQVYENPFPF